MRIHTTSPFPLLPAFLSVVGIVSHHQAEATTEDYNGGKAAIGTGAWRFAGWQRGDRIVLDRNPDYWGTAPEWDRATLRFIRAPASRLAALLAGDVDIVAGVAVDDIERLRQDARFTVSMGESDDITGYVLDVAHRAPPFITRKDGSKLTENPFADLRVRRAVAMAIDRDAIVSRVLNGAAVATGQYMARGAYGYDPTLQPPPFDPEGARRLLAEAGYPEGFRLTIQCQNNYFINDSRICQTVSQMLTRIGIATTPDTMTHAMWLPHANNHEWSMFPYFWNIETGDPSIMLMSQLSRPDKARGRGLYNRGQYDSQDFENVLDRALTTIDDAAREKLLIAAGNIAFRDIALLPLHHQMNVEAMARRFSHTPRTDGRIYPADVHSTAR